MGCLLIDATPDGNGVKRILSNQFGSRFSEINSVSSGRDSAMENKVAYLQPDITSTKLQQYVQLGEDLSSLPGCTFLVYDDAFDNPDFSMLLDAGFDDVCPADNTDLLVNRIENYLRDREEDLSRQELVEAYVEGSTVAAIIVGEDGDVVFANPSAGNLFGYDQQEWNDLSLQDLLPQSVHEVHLEHRKQFFQDPEARPMGEGRELFAVRKDGEQVPVEIGLNPIQTDRGSMVVAEIVGISERKRLEKRVREQLYRKIADHVPGVLFEFRPDPEEEEADYSFTFMSDGYQELAGVSSDQAMENFDAVFQHIHPEDRESVREDIEWAIDNRQSFEREVRHLHPNGDVTWDITRAEPIRKEDGNLCWFGVSVDITDRKELEQKLQKRNKEFRQLAESVEDVFFLASADFSSMHYISPAFGDRWGKKIEDVYDDPWALMEIINERDRRSVEEHLKELVNDGLKTINSQEYRITCQEGNVRWIEQKLYPVTASDGSVQRMAGVLHDITERKERERLEEQKRIAEKADRVKSEFLKKISHNLRTPLHVITGAGDLLTETELSDEQDEYVQQIQSQTVELTKLVEDLLDLSLADSGELHINHAPFHLPELIHNVASHYLPDARTKGVDLIVNLSPDLPRRPNGPAGRIRQVLMELVDNAVKFTESGEVRISINRYDTADGDGLALTVQDTGAGLEGPEKEQLFHPFEISRTSYNTHDSDTGLGLSLVQELVDEMGGDLELRSEPEKGTTITVRVPLGMAGTGEEYECLGDHIHMELSSLNLDGFQVLIVSESGHLPSKITETLKPVCDDITVVRDLSEYVEYFEQANIGEHQHLTFIERELLEGDGPVRVFSMPDYVILIEPPPCEGDMRDLHDDTPSVNTRMLQPVTVQNLVASIKQTVKDDQIEP